MASKQEEDASLKTPLAASATEARSSSPSAESLKKLTILTYNVGLLRFKCCGCCTVFSNPPYANERLPFIPAALKSTNADIIALQECYEEAHARFIAKSLSSEYPYTARSNSGGCLKFHNGLFFLSKYPIEGFFLQRLRKVSTLEKWLATKSNLAVRVSLPGIGKVTFVNMHTTAGGTTHPEHPDSDLDREDELLQAYQICTDAMSKNSSAAADTEKEVAIIIGDLNCGPEASADNYEYILKKGFRDIYLEAMEEQRITEGSPQFTWDPENYLNQIGPHANCPGQRVDHILLPLDPSTGMDNWEVESLSVVFQEKKVDIGKGVISTLSDHHGLLATLRIK